MDEVVLVEKKASLSDITMDEVGLVKEKVSLDLTNLCPNIINELAYLSTKNYKNAPSVVAGVPNAKNRIRAGAEKKTSSLQKSFKSIARELSDLVELDITAPENVSQVGSLMTRMLFLDFIAHAAKIKKPHGVVNATNRTADYFNKNPRNKTKSAYLWGVRMYSELHNCLTLVESRVEASDYLLDLLSNHNMGSISEHGSFDFVVETICYIKAYNLLMDVVAKKFKTPELSLAKISLDKIKRSCVLYNTAVGTMTFCDNDLSEFAPSRAKSEILYSINHNAATLFSAMVAGYNILLVGDCAEVEL